MQHHAFSGSTLGRNREGRRHAAHHRPRPHDTNPDQGRFFAMFVLHPGGATHGHAAWSGHAQTSFGESDSNMFVIIIHNVIILAENTDFVYKWKYHCTAGLMFDRFGIS